MIGSPAYIAPERISGFGSGSASDQYSLALTYYVLRTGELPVPENASLPAAMSCHMQHNLALGHLPDRERAVVERATALDPNQRFPACAEFANAILEAVSEPSASTVRIDTVSANFDDEGTTDTVVNEYLKLVVDRWFPGSEVSTHWNEFFGMQNDIVRRYLHCDDSPRNDTVARVWTEVSQQLLAALGKDRLLSPRTWLHNALYRQAVVRSRLAAAGGRSGETNWSNPGDREWIEALMACVLTRLRVKISSVDFKILECRLVERLDADTVAQSMQLPSTEVRYRYYRSIRRLRAGLAFCSGQSMQDFWTTTFVERVTATMDSLQEFAVRHSVSQSVP
jgi:hypothetical protein